MLLEDACKQLDLKCVLEGSTSADSGCDPSDLTYSILTVGNRDISDLV